MSRILEKLLHAPPVVLAFVAAGLTLYWFLRMRATRSASYVALEEAMGPAGWLEKVFLASLIGSFWLLIAFRLVSESR